jgi:hypothetical protein
MLHIDWRRLPDRPIGTQDSAAGILDGDFVVVLGNRGKVGTPAHAGQGGMWNGGHALPVADTSLQGWRAVPDVPSTTPDGSTRLGVSTGTTAAVTLPGGASALAFVGGFSHTNCSREAFLMRKQRAGPGRGANFSYDRLPSLPWDIAESDLVAVGSKLYSIGGADCGLNPNVERFLTWSDRWGGNRGLGRRVLVLDLAGCPLLGRPPGAALAGRRGDQVEAAACRWKQLANFPGTPRSGASVAAIGDTVFVLGGYASANSSVASPPPKHQPCTSLSTPGCLSNPADNWKLDTVSMKWTLLRGSGAAYPVGDTKGFGVWRDRYIISVGAISRGRSLTYPEARFVPIANDSLLRSSLNDSCSPPLKGWGPNSYPNTITVFDTQTSKVGTVTTSSKTEPALVKKGCPAGLPLNCYSPAVGLVGDQLFVHGGECDPVYVPTNAAHGGLGHGYYWHYPRITLHGQLSESGVAAALKLDDRHAAPKSPTVPASLSASFEGGNMNETVTRWVAENVLQYEGALKCGPASTKCSPYTNWAYFSVSNLSTTEPTTLHTLSGNWLSDPWFSYEDSDVGLEWTRLTFPCASCGSRKNSNACGCHVHRFSKPLAFVAFSIPYVRRQRARLFADLKESTTAAHTVTEFNLATSEAGYDVSGVNISAAEAASPQRALLWFQAGQHAWESGGRWASDGLARFAASIDGAKLLQHADVVVVPIMDIDNVVVGGAGKDSEPVDFNRDWCPLGGIARNQTRARCQHWKAIGAAVQFIRTGARDDNTQRCCNSLTRLPWLDAISCSDGQRAVQRSGLYRQPLAW